MNKTAKFVRRLSLIVTSGVLACSAVSIASATEVAGIRFEDVARVENKDLKLNGAGIRDKAIFNSLCRSLVFE